MAFDQNITYRVNLDDSDFQAKLSQLRASVDTTMGSSTFGGMGMGGSSMAGMMSMLGPSGFARNGTDMMMGGLADFGSQIRPVTYTPPAIAMSPHFGMIRVQQTMAQAGLGSMGPWGAGVQSFFGSADVPPASVSVAEYSTLSARSFGTRIGDATATAALVGGGTFANLAAGGAGAAVGGALFGGMLGGLAGGIAGGIPISMLSNSVGEMMAQNRSVQTQLEAGSFRFITGGKDADPLTGRGFSRQARAGAADYVQSLELQDVRFGMGEMKQVLEAGMQFDMFAGTKDVDDFKSKFKGLVDTLKTVTATLHTSLKDGMEVMRGFRDMGVTDPGTMNSLTMRAETMGRMSGRTGMEMLAVGQTGAEMFRGTGVNMQVGFELNQQNAMMVRTMLNQGTISRESVSQAGGENSLAQQLTANALASTQSALGRGALMANYDPSTGGLRAGFLGRMAGQDAMSMVGGAAALAGNPAALIGLQAHQEELISGMGPMGLQMFGISTGMAAARTVSGATGASLEDSYVAMRRRQGVSIDVIKTEMGMLHTDPNQIKASQEAAVSAMGQQAALEDIRNRYGYKAIDNVIRRNLVQPFQRELSALSTGISQAVENTTMRLMGANIVDRSTVTSESVKRGEAIAAAGPRLPGEPSSMNSTDLGVADASGNIVQRMLGGSQSGEGLARALMGEGGAIGGLAAQTFSSVDEVQAAQAAKGERFMILSHSAGGGDKPVVAVPVRQLRAFEKQRRDTDPGKKDIEAADSFRLSDQQMVSLEDIRMGEETTGRAASLQSVGTAIFGGKFSEGQMTSAQRAILSKVLPSQRLAGALKTFNAVTGSGTSDAEARAATGDFEKGKALFNKTKSALLDAIPLGNREASRTMGSLSVEQVKLVTDLESATDPDAKMLIRAKLGDSGLSEHSITAMDTILSKGLKEDQKKELRSNLATADFANYTGQQGKDAAAGAKLGVGGGGIGQVTQEAVTQMSNMSAQLVKNMELLLALQKQFNASRGSQ